jgi:hypothetical protein
LHVSWGNQVSYRRLCYKDNVLVNVARIWRKGHKGLLLSITNLDPEEELYIFGQRMKIEESIKDLKSLPSMDKVMDK